jgi:exonuclease VII small subunit
MDYLHKNKLYKSLLALEDETGSGLYSYSKEIKFFRNLIIDGQWEDAENFLQPLKLKKNFNYNAVIYELRKQKFLEMVDKNESYVTYVKALKGLEELWTKEEFNSLWYCLTISQLNDHPNYSNWTAQNGRFMTFEKAKKHLWSVFSNIENQKINLEADLEELLKYSYGIMQKKKATKIIEQQLGYNIVPIKKQAQLR